MSDQNKQLREVLPKAGLVVSEKGNLTEVLCKPKIMPLKSITLQKLEEMEKKITELASKQNSDSHQAMDSMARMAAQQDD